MSGTQEIRRDRLEQMEAEARVLARAIDETVNPEHARDKSKPKKTCMVLILSAFDGAELTYVANSQRAETIQMLEEMVENLKRQIDAPPLGLRIADHG